jgi:uncharacterized phage protein (TIGR02220 family)
MAQYRKVDSRIWNDERFMRLSDDGKLVFLMLLTHPGMTALGAMRMTAEGLAGELGWLPERLTESLNESLREGMVEVDRKARFIGLPNFLKYNQPESPNVVKAWVKCLDLIPECEAKTRMVARSQAFLKGLNKAFAEAFAEAFAKAMPNQEQEQEQEKKHEVFASLKPHAMSGKPDDAYPELTNPEPEPDPDFEPQPVYDILEPAPKRAANPKQLEANKRAQADRARRMRSARELLELLNAKAGRRYGPLDSNLEPIAHRLRDLEAMDNPALTPEQAVDVCRGMIVRMANRWMGTEMEQYLRPFTLFGKEKFGSYVGDTLASMFPKADEPQQAELEADEGYEPAFADEDGGFDASGF